MGAFRSTSRGTIRHGRATTGLVLAGVALAALVPSTAGATATHVVATTNGNGAVLVALGGAVLLFGIVGFVVFTWTRRKRRPDQCAEQREALELAEKAVRYWEAAHAHLAAVTRPGNSSGDADAAASHAAALSKSSEGLRSAIQQRDQRQMDLIRCMASGVPGVPVITTNQAPAHPFFTPDADETPSSGAAPTEP